MDTDCLISFYAGVLFSALVILGFLWMTGGI